MPKCLRLLFPLLITAFLGAQAPATLGLQEIHPGMKGQGRTVFQGGRIDRFTFEVLGVQRDIMPGRSLIMIRASGGPLAETGVMQGMSGSPCYIGDKLIGALSIAFPFEKEPIAGVTPIGEMLDQLRDLPDLPSSRTPLILPKVAPPAVLKSALTGTMVPVAQLLGVPPVPGRRERPGDPHAHRRGGPGSPLLLRSSARAAVSSAASAWPPGPRDSDQPRPPAPATYRATAAPPTPAQPRSYSNRAHRDSPDIRG